VNEVIPDSIVPLLWQFDGHSLADLDKASLMDRVDTKFVMPTYLLPEMLMRLQEHYTALQIGDNRCFLYNSTYFDTPDRLFYKMHHSGRLNRYKVRVRHYVDSDLRFLEVKFKNNKGRTEKNRIKLRSGFSGHLEDHGEFLSSLRVPQFDQLSPTLNNQYHRIALASEQRAERLTIDLNLANQPVPSSRGPVFQSQLTILELKQARMNRTSPFFDVIKALKIRPSGFSKYCMGLAMAASEANVKYNRFKPLMHRLKRVCNYNGLEGATC
jgi:hypothetical protein